VSDRLKRKPDQAALEKALTVIFPSAAEGGAPPRVLERHANRSSSSFPSEFVTLCLGSGERLRLFCKYEGGYSHSGHGHRGGVALEAAVYRDLLQRIGSSVPTFHGSYVEPASGETWLFTEFIDGVRLNYSPDTLIRHAAEWLGTFHAAAERWLASEPAQFLPGYDAEYYHGWARRTVEYAEPLLGEYGWLAQLCAGSEAWIAPLLKAPRTVVHGEYYPKNILERDGTIWPVDWESAAIAAGEIDLASITEGWSPSLKAGAVTAYRRARWPRGAPRGFSTALAAARVYLHLRWLGNQPHRTVGERLRWRFDALRYQAERLGMI